MKAKPKAVSIWNKLEGPLGQTVCTVAVAAASISIGARIAQADAPTGVEVLQLIATAYNLRAAFEEDRTPSNSLQEQEFCSSDIERGLRSTIAFYSMFTALARNGADDELIICALQPIYAEYGVPISKTFRVKEALFYARAKEDFVAICPDERVAQRDFRAGFELGFAMTRALMRCLSEGMTLDQSRRVDLPDPLPIVSDGKVTKYAQEETTRAGNLLRRLETQDPRIQRTE